MHDGYLKLYQLSKPQLDYDYILLDEAHDTNGVTLDLFLNQRTAAKIIVGDQHQCQPKGTLVKLEGNIEKDISEIKIGDKLITYQQRHSNFVGLKNQGRKVVKTNSRFVDENLYKISTINNSTLCTNNHKWLVKFSNCENSYMVYLMQKQERFRIGVCKAFYKHGAGVGVRCRNERAEKGWILKICDSFEEACLEERFASYEFGISQQVFQERSKGLILVSQKFIDNLYNRLSNMKEKANRCLKYYGRDMKYPIYTNGNGLQRGGRRAFLTQACNLINNKMKAPIFKGDKNPKWENINVEIEAFKGKVYSLEVEDNHTYIANNILTHNSCYAFRHAYNAMAEVHGDIHKYLSNSFRFGNNIAHIANLVLNKVKKEPKKLNGKGPLGAVGWIDQSLPFTVVARTNAALFDEAADLLIRKQSFGFIGTSERDNFSPFKHYYFDRILDVYYLSVNRRNAIKDKYIKRFKNYDDFMKVIKDKDAPDIELQSRASVVNKHKEKIPLLIDSICYNSVNPKKAQILFTTAHRSKGLEWDQVRMTHDFAEVIEIDKKTGKAQIISVNNNIEEELNLLYIGATRAKRVLQLNKSLLSLVEFIKNEKNM